MNDVTISDRAPEPVGPYPHARRAGNYIFLSGVGPRSRASSEIPGVTLDSAGNIVEYCIETQCRSCFENVRHVVEDAGARWEEVVDVTVFLTDMKKDFCSFNRVYEQYFGEIRPCRTTVEVAALPTPIAVELKVTVYAPRD
ncbi:MAG: RidA family protein [Planctomycetes bacterium]|jgi:2-aminomuconate deaminase|nr:RidA family protein [Planctomycetota bacterium]MBT6452769.1 RidA family protein [Planctomycetota bacterium]MBT6541051.1 RidA family protein [Planctomycetota bacterium]MBT6785345.1 RidA family protein [Planctomycetota bacterium]MBT6968584.1 RidA family protein [Planctomycetota bacterium]